MLLYAHGGLTAPLARLQKVAHEEKVDCTTAQMRQMDISWAGVWCDNTPPSKSYRVWWRESAAQNGPQDTKRALEECRAYHLDYVVVSFVPTSPWLSTLYLVVGSDGVVRSLPSDTEVAYFLMDYARQLFSEES